MKIVDGWVTDINHDETNNAYSNQNTHECIVMHYTASYDLDSPVKHFKKRSSSASAHFVIGVDGAIVQMVSLDDGAWHSGGGVFRGRGDVNRRSVGIEIVNPGYHFKNSNGDYLNWERKKISASKLAPFPGMIEARDPWVGSAQAHWPVYPEPQLAAVEKLTKLLLRKYRSIVDIVGHRDVDTVRKWKVDPGPAFPMQRYRMLLDDRSAAVEGAQKMRVETNGGGLNVRGGPGVSFDKLSWGPLRNGDEVTALEYRDGWYRVEATVDGGPRQGWCYGLYLVSD